MPHPPARLLLALLLALAAALPAGEPAGRPNIVVILVDDLGFSDFGCYGSEIPTPNIDRLAAGGLRFTQFYNTGRCCPSRASLLTGLYPHQAGIGHMLEDQGVPGYRGQLNDRCVTIAEVLRAAGYFTAMTGKWHVGQEHGVTPPGRGFMRSLNAPAGGFYFADGARSKLFLDGRLLANDDPFLPQGWYSTDLWTDVGVRFIDEALNAKQPFFLYLAHNAPHFPLQAPLDEIAHFRATYQVGWDQLRAQRLARQQQLGFFAADCRLSPRANAVQAWDVLSANEQERFDHIMSVYAAAVAHVDTAIGRLVAALTQRGVLDDTLILLMSDNGGNAEGGPEGTAKGAVLGSVDSSVFCGQSWATLENTPLVRYKHFNHEGGISTPLIAHWPARISDHGALRTQPGHLIDIMATCVEVSGAAYPTTFQDHPILPMEGRSLVPTFANQPIVREALFWEHEGNAAVRVGDDKLVRVGRGGAWELYDMKADRVEQHDLAATRPGLVKELAARWQAWAERAQVKPYPEGGAKGKKGKKGDKGEAGKDDGQ